MIIALFIILIVYIYKIPCRKQPQPHQQLSPTLTTFFAIQISQNQIDQTQNQIEKTQNQIDKTQNQIEKTQNQIEKTQNRTQLQIYFEISLLDNAGPHVLGESYISSIEKYNNENKKCKFYSIRFPYTNPNKISNSTNAYYWLHRPDKFIDVLFRVYPSDFVKNHVLLGPIVVPSFWARFPDSRNPVEREWPHYLSRIFGYTVQTYQIKNRLIKLSHTENLSHKYVIAPFCKYLPDQEYKLKDYKDREIDIIFYTKFADTREYMNMAIQLQSKLQNEGYKLYYACFGNYKKSELMKTAENAKYVIYFSTFDNGPSALIELIGFGCYCFVLQPEFLFLDNGLYVPEMLNDTNYAFNKIDDVIKKHMNNPINCQMLGEMNRKHYSCYRSFDVLCDQIHELRNNNYL